MTHFGRIGIALAGVAAVAALVNRGALPPWGSAASNQPLKVEHTYLSSSQLPDSLALLPPPPAPGTPELARDIEARNAALKFQGTPRYALAASDANREQAPTVQAFTCAFGMDITPTGMPTLYKLLSLMRLDVRASAYRAKSYYKRVRPHVSNSAKSCAPTESLVRDDGSYPSARAAVGFAFASVLADLNPARRAEIGQRGLDFGQSRVICDAEWQSDVDAGKILGEADVRRLLQSKEFRADLERARAEVTSARKTGAAAPRQCSAESKALAMR